MREQHRCGNREARQGNLVRTWIISADAARLVTHSKQKHVLLE